MIPDYAGDVLGGVLPSAAAALGVDVDLMQRSGPRWQLPAAERVCVVLIDGLGAELLADPSAKAPFLKEHLQQGRTLRAGFPTTTAVSMGSFGTGRPPGQHGLVGYEMLDPDRDRLLNGLHWDDVVDPLSWQPYRTFFERLERIGLRTVRIGPERFDGSGLTRAALRGGTFAPATALRDSCAAAQDALADLGDPVALAYLYWGGVDYAGHTHGWRSRQWRAAVAEVDRAMAKLYRGLAPGTLLLITADHGMVDLAHRDRHDLASTPALLADVRHIGGETRCPQLYVEPGTAERVARRFEDAFGDRAWVRTRQQAVEQGWFGQVDDRVLPRIGDVLVAAYGAFGLVDSRVVDPKVLRMIGQHGSLTEAEQLIPLIAVLRS